MPPDDGEKSPYASQRCQLRPHDFLVMERTSVVLVTSIVLRQSGMLCMALNTRKMRISIFSNRRSAYTLNAKEESQI